jgi:hypothetical protein
MAPKIDHSSTASGHNRVGADQLTPPSNDRASMGLKSLLPNLVLSAKLQSSSPVDSTTQRDPPALTLSTSPIRYTNPSVIMIRLL